MITSPNVEGTNDLTNSSRGSGTPPWLYHAGPTMVARAWPKPSPRQLENSQRPSASSRCFSFVSAALWWMDGSGGWRRQRQFIDKHQGQKGDANRAQSGPTGPGPFRPSSAPVSSPVASCVIPYLCALACGPLTSFPSLLRLESLLSKLRRFLVESLKTCMLTLRSSGHLESCSSCVLTCDGLHDLLLKCLMNLSRKSPL
jgi:hypothetical protein